MFSNKKQMPNGCLLILNYVHGVKKLLKEVQVVILWRVFVERAFVTCVPDLGSQIIRITSSVIFTKRAQQNKSVDKNKFCKK